MSGLENIGVSVVIVTYNGKEKIKPTLQHLASQNGIDFDWEVVLVDNNSTDNTSNYAEEIWRGCGDVCPFRIITEKKSGTMYARENGMINSAYRYLLFCDDDNWLSEYYIKTAFEKICSNDEVAGVGGRGIMEFEKDFTKPKWVDRHAGKFGTGPQGNDNEDVKSLYTAGAIFDRVWLEKLYTSGFKSMLKGRDGKSLIAGEDTELCFGINLIGGKLRYCHSMWFKHFMPSERIRWEYLIKLTKAMEKGAYLLKPYQKNINETNIIFEYLKTSALIVKYFIKSSMNGFKEGEEYVIHLNRFVGRLEILKNAKQHHKKTQKIINQIMNYKKENG